MITGGLTSIVNTESWTDQALCATVDPELWFPEKGALNREAKRICGGCPVAAECLEYALARNERYGIWGGYSELQRRGMRGPLPKGIQQKPITHGTYGGAVAHRRRDEPICDACRRAEMLYRAEKKKP